MPAPSVLQISAAIILATAVCSTTHAQALPQPGAYETHGGGASMTIKAVEGGKLRFAIESIGGNGHMCNLTGSITGTTGIADDDGANSPEPCKISFMPGKSLVEVAARSDSCRNYCGARAGFDGTYWLPPEACRSEQRAALHDGFTLRYRQKQYAQAYDILKTQFDQCAQFFDWIEIDTKRNDLAVTAFHLGRPDECRQILDQAAAAKYRTPEELREALPPTDFDAYLSVARATWHNQKLCGGGKASAGK